MCTPREESVRNRLKRRGYVASKRRGDWSLRGVALEDLERFLELLKASSR